MTYPDDILAGLDPTPAERLEFLRALDELDAEEAAGEPAPDPDGPWDDFNAATAQMDAAHAADAQLDAQRTAEDIEDALERRPSAETRIERAMGRISRGSYTAPPPQQQFQSTRDVHGVHAPGACGDADDLGYCTSRYHDPGCSSTVAGTAAVESVASAEAWNRTLRNHPPDPGTLGYTAELAGPADPLGGSDTWADLLHSGVPDHEVHQRMLAELGEAEPPAREPREPMPDVSGFRSAMGL